MHQFYAKLSSHQLAVGKRERAAAHMHGTMSILARLTIVLSIKNLYHIRCQYVDELSS